MSVEDFIFRLGYLQLLYNEPWSEVMRDFVCQFKRRIHCERLCFKDVLKVSFVRKIKNNNKSINNAYKKNQKDKMLCKIRVNYLCVPNVKNSRLG